MRTWLKSLIAAAVGGGATALSNALAFAVAKDVGIDVPTLNVKALAIITAVGAVSSVAAYLKKSPVPDDDAHTSRH